VVGWQPPPTHRKNHRMRFTPQFPRRTARARLPVSEVVGRRVKLKKGRARVERPVAVSAGEVAVVHGQRPEGFLPRLLVRQARRHHLVPDGDRGRRLHRGRRAVGADGGACPLARRPHPTPARHEQRRKTLHDVMELAAKFFADTLASRHVAPRRARLSRRPRDFRRRSSCSFASAMRPASALH